MSTVDGKGPGIGHNWMADLLSGDELKAYLEATYGKDFARAVELLAALDRVPKDDKGNIVCLDDDWRGKLSDFIVKVQTSTKELESHRTAEKSKYDEAAGLVHGIFKGWQDKLAAAKLKVSDAVLDFNRKIEREKRAKLEEERRAREEEQRAAQAAADKAARDAREAQAAADKKAREAREAEAAAARKRSLAAKEEADAEAAHARAAREAAEAEAAAAAREADEAAKTSRERTEEAAKAGDAAEVSSADLTRARGTHSVSSTQAPLSLRIPDRTLIDGATIDALWPFISTVEIEKAARGFMRANSEAIKAKVRKGDPQPLAGIEYFFEERLTSRRG